MALASAVLCVLAGAGGVRAQDLGTGQFQILGTSLDISPEAQAVPVGIPTVIHTSLPALGASIPSDVFVRGELTGPGVATPAPLITTPNADFLIPGQTVKGDYVVSNIRLVQSSGSGETVLGYSAHRTATITVADVLLTQVTSRPLTYQEMIDKGLVLDRSDFSAYDFTFSIVLGSQTVNFDLPLVFTPNGAPILPTIPVQSGTPPGGEGFRPPQVNALDLTGGPTGTVTIPADSDGNPVIRIPTLLLIPGDVAFLNQFLSVSVLVQNGSPAGSDLQLHNITATPHFPGNLQEVSSTPVTNIGDPVAIHDPGPDGVLGTTDDITFLVGQEKGSAEFVVEGLRPGTYDVPINVDATITGLPNGPLPVHGVAHGSVLVRHPSFFITLDHPDTIRQGEQYTVTATVTNTSTVQANLVSLTLDQNSITGATLLSPATVALGNIDPRDNAIATFQFQALRTGRVVATAVFADGSASGAILLTAGVGELGIPISPDTLILPREVSAFPQDDLVTPARELLGLGWSLAKSPAGTTDPSLPPIGEQAVRWRVHDLALAARHQMFGQAADLSLAEWTLEWLNANPATTSANFDLLRRETNKGSMLSDGVGNQLSLQLANETAEELEQRILQNLPELPHLSAFLSEGSDTSNPVARLSLVDLASNVQSQFRRNENGFLRNVANAEIFPLNVNGSVFEYGWIGQPVTTGYQVQVIGEQTGAVDLSVYFPDGSGGVVEASFSAIPMTPGVVSYLNVQPGQLPGTLTLQSTDGGTVEGSLRDLPAPPLTVELAAQNLEADPRGKAIAVLLNRAVDPTAPASSSASNFLFAADTEDPVNIALPQADDPRLIILGVNNHPSPYRSWQLQVSGLTSASGIALSPSVQLVPVAIVDLTPGGSVAGQVISATGQPVPNADVVLRETATSDITGQQFYDDWATAQADGNGQFLFDYVPLRQGQVFEIDAADPATGYGGTAFGQIHQERETLHLNLVLLGRGDVSGTVRDETGTPLAGAYVTASSVMFPGSSNQASTNTQSDGTFTIHSLPVGPVQLWAIYQGPTALKTGYQTAYIPAPGGVANQDIVLALGSSATVSGTITHESDGSAASGLSVVMYGEPVAVPYPPFFEKKYFGYQVTDGNGQFSFPLVSPGNDQVYVYDPSRGWAVVIQDTVNVLQDTDNVLQLVELDPQLHFGSVAGHVYRRQSGTQAPDANAIVWLVNMGLQVTTDATGAYRLDGVPVGAQSLDAYDQSLGQTVGGTTTVQEGVTATLDFTFASPSGLQGAVVDPLGNPVANAGVAYFDSNGAVIAGVTTDGSGHFQFPSIPAGSYRIYAYGADTSTGVLAPDVGYTDVAVQDGQLNTTVIAMRGFGTVQGTVTTSHLDDQGNLVQSPAEAHLSLTIPQIVTVNGTPYGRIAGNGDPQYPGALQADSSSSTGVYSFSNVLVQSFQLAVHSPILGDKSAQGTITHFGQVVTENFSFTGSSSLDGYLYDERGQPVGGGSVSMYGGYFSGLPPEGTQPLATVTTTTDSSDPHGAGYFLFATAPPGSYSIIFQGAADGRERFAFSAVSVPANPVNVRTTLRAGRIQDLTVTVQQPDGNGGLQVVAGASVAVTEAQFPLRSFSGTTASDGTLTFPGLSEGPFTVRAQSFQEKGTVGGCVCNEGGVAQATLVLSGSGAVAGQVLFPGTNAPVPNAQVLVSTYGNLIGAGQTDSSGSYLIDGLPLNAALAIHAADNASARSGIGPNFVLTTDGQVYQANITLIALGSVAGTFMDSSGTQPIVGATVTLGSSSQLGGYTFRSGTDGSGAFTIPGVPAGTFTLDASDSEHILTAHASGALSTEGQIVTVPLLAEPTGSIAIHVVDSSGAELPADAPPPIVTLSGGGEARTVTTNQYQFDSIPVGVSFTVTAEEQASGSHHKAAGAAMLSAGGQVAQLLLQYVPYGQVNVNVVRVAPDGTQTPLTSGSFYLVSSGVYGAQFPFGALVTVDGQGAAQFVNVGGPIVANYFDPTTGLTGSASGAITTEGQNLALTITVPNAAPVTGRALLPAPNNASPAAGALVTLQRPYGQPQTTVAAADGTFTFPVNIYANYTLNVLDEAAPGRYRQSFTLSSSVLVNGVLNLGDIVLDGVPPSVTSTDPADGATNLSLQPSVRLTFSEPVNSLSPLLAQSADSSVSGNFTLAADKYSGTWIPSTNLRSGESYELFVLPGNFEDLNGWPIQGFTMGFSTASTVGPSVIQTTPAAGSIQIPLSTPVAALFDKAIDPSSITSGSITLQEVLPTPGSVSGAVAPGQGNASAVAFSPSVPALDGAALYRVTVSGLKDTSGNAMAQPYSYQFWTVDNQPPAVHFVSPPASGLTLHTYQFTVGFDSYDVASLRIKANGATVATFSQSIGDTQRVFSYRIDSSLAGTQLQIAAIPTDFSGNIGAEVDATVSVTADHPPSGTITLSPAGPISAGQTVTATVSASDDIGLQYVNVQISGVASGGCSIPASGQIQLSGTCVFAVPLSASAGGNLNFVLQTYDGFNPYQSSEATIAVLTDSVPPVVTGLSPANGSAVASGSTVAVQATATDDVGIAQIVYTAGSQSFTATHSPFLWNWQVPVVGSITNLTINATAYDYAGNSASMSTTVQDSPDLPPSGTFAITPGGPILPGQPFTVTVSASDDFDVANITVNVTGAMTASQGSGVTGTSVNRSFTFTIPTTVPGGSTITVTPVITDNVNLRTTLASQTVSVDRDVTPPVITSLQPADGSTFMSGQVVSFLVQATDNVVPTEADFTINGASQVAVVTIPFATTWVAIAVTQPTIVPVHVVVKDLAGNQTSRDISITVTPNANAGAPTVNFVCPTSGGLFPPGYAVSVTIHATDDQAVQRVDLYVDNSQNPISTTAQSGNLYTASYPIPSNDTDGTQHILRAIAYDYANNASVATSTLTVVQGDVFATSASIFANDSSHDGHTIIVTGGILTIQGHHAFNGMTVLGTATVTQLATTATSAELVDLVLGSRGLYVACNGRIDVSTKGYLGGWQGGSQTATGQTYPGVTPSAAESGGSHGGLGDDWDGTLHAGAAYGSVTDPAEAGAGSGGYTTNCCPGSPGGGIVHIVAGQLALDGKILADGTSTGNSYAQGAGGTIRLDTGALSGAGTIEAIGGGNAYRSGGGGRIAIYADTSGFNRTNVTAHGGGTYGYPSGGAGTVYFKSPSQAYGDLVVDNANLANGAASPLTAASAGTITSVNTGGSGIAISDTAKSFPYGVVGEYLQITRSGSIIGAWRIIGYGADAHTVILDSAANVQVGDSYQGIYQFDSVTVTGKATLASSDPILTPVFTNGGQSITLSAPIVGAATLTGGTVTLAAPGGSNTWHFDSLTVQNGTFVTVPAVGPGGPQALTLNVSGSLTIDATSKIDLTGLGYRGGLSSGNTSLSGESYPGVPGPQADSGGSHGGAGKDYDATHHAGTVYGSVFDPAEAGQGGSTGNGYGAAGNGGGVIHIIAGSAAIDGQVAVSGTVGSAGGAGGSIRVDAGQLSGAGNLNAGIAPGGSGWPGGGGRIAIYGDTTGFNRSHLQVSGGNGGSAGAGTILFQSSSQAYGDLIVDNGASSGGAVTPLVVAGSGTVSAVGAAGGGISVSDSNKTFPYGVLGEYLQITRSGSVVGSWRIVGYGSDAHTVVLDPAANVQVGDSYQGIYQFDSVTVKGKATLRSGDPILSPSVSVQSGSHLEDPTRDAAPMGTVTLNPSGSMTGGHTLSVIVTASDDNVVASVHVAASGAVSFAQTDSPGTASFSKTYSISVPTNASGVISVDVTITDDWGHSIALPTQTITVTSDQPPTIALSTVPIGSILAGQNLAVTASLTDDHGLSSVTVSASGAATFNQSQSVSGTAATRTFTISVPQTAPNNGTITILGSVRDNANQTTNAAPVAVSIIPDTQAPQISNVSPVNGTIVVAGATVTVSASVTDNVGVASVVIAFNGQATTLTQSPYQATFTAPAETQNTSVPISISATDYAGNTSQVPETVNVRPATGPVVAFACGSNGAMFPPGYSANVTVTASGDQPIIHVDFFANGGPTLFATATTAPYSATYGIATGAADGTPISIQAIAYDSTGASGQSTANWTVVQGDVLSGTTEISPSDTSHDGNTVIIEGNLTIDGHHSFNGLVVLSGSVVTHSAATSSSTSAVDVDAGARGLFVECGGSVSADKKGYLGGKEADNSGVFGLTEGNSAATGSGIWSDGSHGGKGEDGDDAFSMAGEAFDSAIAPAEPGGGGGSDGYTRYGGAGGGVVRITTGPAIVDGVISADAESGQSTSGGGGSILLAPSMLSGGGAIHASANGGGGGRIAIVGPVSGFDLSQISLEGGAFAGAGTLFVWQAPSTLGSLTANAHLDIAPTGTYLIGAGSGTVGAVNAGPNGIEVSDPNNTFSYGVVGEFLEVSRNGSSVGAWRILSLGSDAHSLMLDGSATVEPGDSYQGAYRFDSVTVANGAILRSTDPVETSNLIVDPSSTFEDPATDAPPTATITLTPSGSISGGDTLTVNVTAADDQQVNTMQIRTSGAFGWSSGQYFGYTSYQFVVPVPLTASGALNVFADVTDDFGHLTTVAQTIQVNPDPAYGATMSIEPSSGTVISGGSILVHASVTDSKGLQSVGVQFISDFGGAGVPTNMSASGSSFSGDFWALTGGGDLGPVEVQLVVTDSNGSGMVVAQQPIVLTPDQSAPTISNLLPADGSQFSSGDYMTISFAASDDASIQSVQVTIAGLTYAPLDPSQVQFDPATGAASVPISLTVRAPLVASPTAVPVTITVYDAWGNGTTSQLTVSVSPRTPTGSDPTAYFLCPATDGYYPAPSYATLNGFGSGGDPIALVEYFDGNNPTPFATFDMESYSSAQTGYVIPQGTAAGTTLPIRVRVTDYANRTAEATASLHVVAGVLVPCCSTTIQEGDPTYEGQTVIVPSGYPVTISGDVHFKDLIVLANASVRALPATSTSVRPLIVDATDPTSGILFVECGATIGGISAGYLGGQTGDNTGNAGLAPPGIISPTTTGAQVPYGGSIFSPSVAGTGSSVFTDSSGNTVSGESGGGLIQVSAQQLLIDGAVSADGNGCYTAWSDPTPCSASGSSGGGITLTSIQPFRNYAGYVSALGGSADSGIPGLLGGTGGAVVLQAPNAASDSIAPLLSGGTGAVGTCFAASSPGTYLAISQSAPIGQLVIDATDTTAQSWPPSNLCGQPAVVMPAVGAGTAATASGTTVADPSAAWVPNQLVGLYVRFNGDASTDRRIVANDANDLTFDGDVSAFAGATYQGVLKVDSLVIRGDTAVSTADLFESTTPPQIESGSTLTAKNFP